MNNAVVHYKDNLVYTCLLPRLSLSILHPTTQFVPIEKFEVKSQKAIRTTHQNNLLLRIKLNELRTRAPRQIPGFTLREIFYKVSTDTDVRRQNQKAADNLERCRGICYSLPTNARANSWCWLAFWNISDNERMECNKVIFYSLCVWWQSN